MTNWSVCEVEGIASKDLMDAWLSEYMMIPEVVIIFPINDFPTFLNESTSVV